MNIPEQSTPEDFRCGYVAIIGLPNAGKSTLLNIFVGEKISIVSDKPQTTRHKILGISNTEHSQIIFLDTPGLLKPRYTLQEAMMRSAKSAIEDANTILLMIDGSSESKEFRSKAGYVFEILESSDKPAYLAINKVDLIPKNKIEPMIEFYAQQYPFKGVLPISAINSFGTAALMTVLEKEMPVHPAFYPTDILSEQNERFFVSEIIREKIFEKFRAEIPYSTTVDIIEFKEEKGSKDVIRAEIYVERDSQKGILIGKGGAALKEIGQLSRKDIEKFLGRAVFLELYVKVREKWRHEEAWLKRLGYSDN